MTAELWIIAIASLVGVSCSLVGVFLVLRRMSMLGDAISHSVLFGIVLSFLLTGSRAGPVMLIGAGVVGVATVYITGVLHKYGKLQEDASIGVTFTWLFALGVILISFYAGRVDLDQECVLYGEITFAPFDTVLLGGVDIGPRSFWMLAVITLCNLLAVVFCYRRFQVVSFDPILAHCIGVKVSLWHYLLMTLVSLTTVSSFDAVGAILVVAMLVVPANAAYLFCRSLQGMIISAVVISLVSAVGGYYLASAYDSSISASIALVSGAILVFVLLFVGDYSLRKKIFRKTEFNQETLIAST